MKYLLFVGVLLVAGQGHAQQVHKCIDGKKISYQSQPCGVGQKQAKTWDAPPEASPSYEQQRAAAQKRRQGEAESAYLRRLAGRENGASYSSRPTGAQITVQQSTACELAKRDREQTLKAYGLRRTHDLLRGLDDAVYRACK